MSPSSSNMSVLLASINLENEEDVEEIRKSILKILYSGEENLATFVQNLGVFLTSQNDEDRKKGTHLLVSVLKDLKKDFLSEKEVEHLVTFFTERLKDVSHIVPYVIQGLLHLTSCVNLPTGASPKILLCLYHSLHIPTQRNEERYACYSILANLLNNPQQLVILQSQPVAQQSEIILGFLQACDGERNPQSLLLSFRVAKALATNFSLGAMTEDFFESFNCYFPVDFKPPVNDIRGITREDLSLALRDCLACSSSFAEFLFPFLLDKLDSTLDTCKVDSFDLLKNVCKVYSSENVEPFLPQIWTKIRSDILTTDSKEVETAALESLSYLVAVLKDNALENFIVKVWKECEPLLDESSDGLKIVITIAKSSEPAGVSIMNLGLPSLLAKLAPKHEASEARKVGALSAICSFLNMEETDKYSEIWRNNGSELLASFFAIWHVSGNSKLLSMSGLTLLLRKCKSIWTKKEIDLIVQHLIYWTKELESDSLQFSESWQDLACALAEYDPSSVSGKLLPMWMDNLEKSFNVSKSVSLLSAVSRISSLNEQIITQLVPKFNSNVFNLNHLKCVLEVSLCNSRRNTNFGDQFFSSCLLVLVNNCIQLVTDPNRDVNDVNNEETNQIRLIIECVTPQLNTENGVMLGTKMISIFNNGTLEELTSPKQILLSEITLSVLSHLSPKTIQVIPSDVLCQFVALTGRLLNESNDPLTLLVAQLLACIINKRDQEEQILSSVEEALSKTVNLHNQVTAWIWVCKAVVLKGSNYQKATEKLMEFLGHEELGKRATEGFNTILADSPRVMSVASEANIKLFYHQRFFMLTQQQLLENYHRSTNGDLKNNYLRALSQQLKFLPSPILRKELPPLLPMLISSLSNEHGEILVSILGSLKELLKTDVELARDHLSSLVNRLLELSIEHPNLMGRLSALECLFYLANLPEEDVLLLSKDVLLKLKPCLDDKKRIVRKQASTSISQWCLIGVGKS